MKPLPLFAAATRKARRDLRLAVHGQKARMRKRFQDARTNQLKAEVGNA